VRKEVKAVSDTLATGIATHRALDPANRIQTYPESQSRRLLSRKSILPHVVGGEDRCLSITHLQQMERENKSADLN